MIPNRGLSLQEGATAASFTTVLIGSISVPVVRITKWGVVARITPEVAAALLAQNTKNRKLRPTRVDRYARDMGRWWLNGQTLTFTAAGCLLDGQHRLTACIKSAVAFETYIIGDIEENARESIDQVLARTSGDVLGFEGETSSRDLAAALSVAWRIENNGTLLNGAGYAYPTLDDLRTYLDANPAIRSSISVSLRASKTVRMPRSVAAGLHYLMSKKSEDQADEFFDRLCDGVGLYEGHPILTLRNALLSQVGKTRRATVPDVAVWTIKAWNAFRANDKKKTVRWRRRGSTSESFPEVK